MLHDGSGIVHESNGIVLFGGVKMSALSRKYVRGYSETGKDKAERSVAA